MVQALPAFGPMPQDNLQVWCLCGPSSCFLDPVLGRCGAESHPKPGSWPSNTRIHSDAREHVAFDSL